MARVLEMTNLEEFRSKRESSKAELERRLHAIKRDVRNETNPVSRDSGEQSLERENDEVIDALGNSARTELGLIKKALSRLDSGDYLICEVCGEDIGEHRLHSIPYTTLCVDCAEDEEKFKL